MKYENVKNEIRVCDIEKLDFKLFILLILSDMISYKSSFFNNKIENYDIKKKDSILL